MLKTFKYALLAGWLFLATPVFASFSYIGTHTLTSSSALLPSTQTNFTVTVDVTDNSLKATGSGGSVTDAQGDDIVFKTASTCASGTMSYEVEFWDGTTGHLVAHVLVASAALSTVFYSCIGDATITTFQGGSAGAAWDANYVLVAHFPNGSSLTTNDSTSAANNLTITGTVTAGAGQVDGAASQSSGGSNYVSKGSAVATATGLTFLSLVKPTLASSYQTVMGISDSTSKIGFWITISNTDKLVAEASDTAGGNWSGSTTAGSLTSAAWNCVAGVFTSSTSRTAYLAGTAATADTTSRTPSSGSLNTTAVGAQIANGVFNVVNGLYDETRISNTARSADWVKATCNALTDSSFVTSSFAATATVRGLLMMGVGK